jgi:predicted PurR-regulated permease PerM
MKETIQNISRGVIGISVVQAAFFGLVILYAGVPAAGFLTFLAFFISLLQIGLIFLVIPVLFWVFATLDFFHAAIIFILLVLVALTDTFLKPFVFARGLRTPMMIIFIGVIGGIASYGFIGIFIGPVVLALFYDLFSHWLYSH